VSDRTPRITVVTATYNRSNVLRLAVESLLGQSVADWELWVIGDACTDDTAEVVAAFRDERIHFLNLETNCGEQSGPNNEGCRRAAGELIAYLNHDDLWFPDHLEACLGRLEAAQADLVFTLGIALKRKGRDLLTGVTPADSYVPYTAAPASTWLLRRQLVESLGGWRPYRQCHSVPSQDFLLRAWRAGFRLASEPRLTAVTIFSGDRAGCYARRDSAEHEECLRRIQSDPSFRAQLATRAALSYAREVHRIDAGPHLRRAVKSVVYRTFLAFGKAPNELLNRYRVRRHGRMVDVLRSRRGLPPIP
jgi:glycosyltransferase involved in cell wall biosynthesis